MKIKHGVWMPGLHEKMRLVLIKSDAIWNAHGEELVITSALDGTHSPGSLHPFGRALDLRTSYFSDIVAVACARTLRVSLGSEYDVINHPHRYDDEGDMESPGHIHAEYDPKGE